MSQKVAPKNPTKKENTKGKDKNIRDSPRSEVCVFIIREKRENRVKETINIIQDFSELKNMGFWTRKSQLSA